MIDSQVVSLIKERFKLGKRKYGHGVPVYSAFSHGPQWGCHNWMEMAKEEFLDGIIYVTADYLYNHVNPTQDRNDYNDLILATIKNWEFIESNKHRNMVKTLIQLIGA